MKLILIAGMHRSGTSYVAELVHAMGASVGSHLLEPAPDNPHGFWEHTEVKRINDELLGRLGGTWDDPPKYLTPAWPTSAGLDRLRREAEDLVAGLLTDPPDAPGYAIKDPRLSLTAPFWNSVLAADVSLIALRDPTEVAQSLRHRNGMAPSRAAALWTKYTVGALMDLPNPRLVSLRQLLANSDEAVAGLAHHVGLVDGVESALEIARTRNRTWAPGDIFHPGVDDPDLELAVAIHELLTSTADLTAIMPILTRIAAQWQRLPLLAVDDYLTGEPGDLLGTAIRSAADRISELERDAESEHLIAAELRTERNQARRDLRGANEQLAAATHEAQTAEQQRARLQQQLEEQATRADEEIRQSKILIAEHEQHRSDEEAKRLAADRNAAAMQQTVKATRIDLEQQSRRARASERQFERLTSRRSVRLAVKLAGVFRPAFRIARRAQGTRVSRRTSASRGGPPETESDRTEQPQPTTEQSETTWVATPRSWTSVVERLAVAPDATVIIPVFNAPVEVERCIANVLAWTPTNHDVLIIDDASTDPAITEILRRAASAPNTRVLHNSTNLGFTRTVNRGIGSTTRDVVILNSDARVGPNWIQNLRAAAYSGDRIASASAVSDNAGAFSVPETGANPSPGLDEIELSRFYAQRSRRYWVSTPTGHGFCMYLRHDAIDEIGAFDVEHFPRGYGEENDWSMRALGAGWSHVVDDATMVFHSNAASFDPAAKAELIAAAREQVNALHPEYTSRVRSFLQSEMPIVRERAREIDHAARATATAVPRTAVRPRILSVVQAGRGGTPRTNRDLMASLERDWDPWILTADGRQLELLQVVNGEPQLVEQLVATAPLGSNRPTDSAYREFAARIIGSMGFELVHVRHLFKHTQHDIPEVVRAIGIPSVLSFHDYYWICPNVHLLDERGTFCSGTCTPTRGDCEHPVPGTPLHVSLKHDWIYQWRRNARTVFQAFDQFVTTSETARHLLEQNYPELEARGIEVIPHGRDLPGSHQIAVEPQPESICVVVIGNLSGPKGGHFLRGLLACDRTNMLDVHVVGDCDPEFLDLRCTFHGRYERDALAATLAPIRPSFAALLSVWPETWSHTLSEAWSVGLPVLVGEKGGALTERVEQHGGGWIIDTDDPADALEQIRSISGDPSEWRHEADLAAVDHQSSADEMADAYRSVYASAQARRIHDHPAVDVRVVSDADGKSPGSAHVRTLRRFGHPAVQRQVTVIDRDRTASSKWGPPAVLWVQRNALTPDRVDAILSERERRLARLVVDLDDDLVNPEGLPRQFARYVPMMRRLVADADLVTVSTAPLAEAVAPWSTQVEILPNQLDETLWWPSGQPPDRKTDDGSLDILYMGTATHAEDLEMVREPLAEFARSHVGPVRLHVIGGAPPLPDEWFERKPVPDTAKEYPGFVAWLRTQGPSFDFAIAPLETSPFNNSKSDLKFLEYAALGLPAILSDVPAYRTTVTHGTDGYLTGHAAEDWVRALTAMASRTYQDRIREAAMSVAATRTIGATADRFVALLTAE